MFSLLSDRAGLRRVGKRLCAAGGNVFRAASNREPERLSLSKRKGASYVPYHEVCGPRFHTRWKSVVQYNPFLQQISSEPIFYPEVVGETFVEVMAENKAHP